MSGTRRMECPSFATQTDGDRIVARFWVEGSRFGPVEVVLDADVALELCAHLTQRALLLPPACTCPAGTYNRGNVHEDNCASRALGNPTADLGSAPASRPVPGSMSSGGETL